MIDSTKLIEIIKNIAQEIEEKKDYLTDLDNKIGDGDHGVNMSRGFQFIVNNLADFEGKTVKEIFSNMGNKLMSKVGGASGPLYAMVFMKGSSAIINDEPLSFDNFHNFCLEASNVIIKLGRANLKDKTMLDVWLPLTNLLETSTNKVELLKNIESSALSTVDLMALRGRASFLKERSIGTMDPGCTSSEIILRHLIKEL